MPNDPRNQSTSWWIISLAMSVTCCAVLFVVFASYLVDLNKSFAILSVRLDMMEQRLNRFEVDYEYYKGRNTIQQVQIVPNDAPLALPAATPPAKAPASAPAASSPTPAAQTTTTPTSSAPPPDSKTAVPEIPAKK
jgi:hypothetical protein